MAYLTKLPFSIAAPCSMIGQGTIGKSVPRQKRDKLEVVAKYKYRVLFLGKIWREGING